MAPSDNKTLPQGAPDISIVGDQVTIFPSGYTEAAPGAAAKKQHDTHDRNLVEHMARFRESPLDFLKELNLHVQGSGWRSYDNVIGQPIFYNGFSENMKSAVMGTSMVKSKIEELAEKRLGVEIAEGLLGFEGSRESAHAIRKRKNRRKEEIEVSLQDVADKLVDEMICKMESKRFIRGAYYLATQLLTRAYHQGS